MAIVVAFYPLSYVNRVQAPFYQRTLTALTRLNSVGPVKDNCRIHIGEQPDVKGVITVTLWRGSRVETLPEWTEFIEPALQLRYVYERKFSARWPAPDIVRCTRQMLLSPYVI